MRIINPYFSNIKLSDGIGLIIKALRWLFVRNTEYRSNRFRFKFEKVFKMATNVPHVQVVPSNRSGIYTLLKALEIKFGDEIIVTGYTCSAVIEPIILIGAKPIYIDIDPTNYCMCPTLVRNLITPRTKVIILQHTYGIAGPIEELVEIANDCNIFLIEDCALALGSKKQKQWLGTFGDAAVWSFELSKTISVGWGGVVGINKNYKLAKRVSDIILDSGYKTRFLASQNLFQAGLSSWIYHPFMPMFFKHYLLLILFSTGIFKSSADTRASELSLPSDWQWKYLINQFERLNEINEKSKLAFKSYQEVLKMHGFSSFLNKPLSEDEILIRFPLKVKNPDQLKLFFEKKGIEIGSWFNSPVSGSWKLKKDFQYNVGSCPNSEVISSQIVNLPLHGRMSTRDVTRISKTLNEYLTLFKDEVIC